MAKQTFKVNVDLDSKSLSKLKKTLADARIKVDEKSIASLETAMASLEAELDRNSEHLNVLTSALENMGGGKPSDLMGGGAATGGATSVLSEIRDLLEANGARLKSLADTADAGFNEAAHKRLKQMSIAQMTLDDQLKTKRIWLRAIIGGGGGQSGLMRALQAGGGALFGSLMEKAQDVFKYQTALTDKTLNPKSATFGSQTEEQKKEQAGGIKGEYDKVSKRAEGKFGNILGKLGGGKGMKVAGAIGLGALGLASIAKKGFQALVEASPMLKQMMKMLNFGVMMILRPIGDFFGFFLRPIFVYLLRKFIIPFYQTYLPIMQTLGTQLGEFVVGWFTWAASMLKLVGWEQKEAGAGGIPSDKIQEAQLKEMERMKSEGASQTEIANRMLEGLTTGGYLTDPDPTMTKWGTQLDVVADAINTSNAAVNVGNTSTQEALDAISSQATIGTNLGFGYGGDFEGGSLNTQTLGSPDQPSFNSWFAQAPPSVDVTINVEGNIDGDVMKMDLEPKMEQIANDVVARVYNLGNRKGQTGAI